MAGLLALMVAALFTGAAIYVNVAEHPARLTLDDPALLTEWKPSYKRGAAMQASLALVGFVLGLIAWWQESHLGFLIGAVAIIAPWPWTLLVIKPVNDALLATAPEQAGHNRERSLSDGVCSMPCGAPWARSRHWPSWWRACPTSIERYRQ